MKFLNKKIIYLVLHQFLFGWIYSSSVNNSLPECNACLEDTKTCFNDSLTNSLTIKSRGVAYINLDLLENAKNRGSIVEISYIITSIKNDSITVQVEKNNNSKNQYIIESRDNRVTCSSRKTLKFYNQDEKIAVYCNNLYYDCDIKYEFSILEPEKEREDTPLPQCSECSSPYEGDSCFESIYLPVHSWYYLYYDGYNDGMYLDFLISSHKKDIMRIEVQSNDGLFYLVNTRRDKVRCSEPQKSIPVRWKSPRIAVYCYNNYIGCKFSLFVRSFPMNRENIKELENEKDEDSFNRSSSFKFINKMEKMAGYAESNTPKWSEWSEWSDCIEYQEGMGRRTRERKCLNTAIDFTQHENVTEISSVEIDHLLKSSGYPYCEGSSIETQNCQLEINEQSLENILILVFIISAMILTFYIERGPKQNNNENIVKRNSISNDHSSMERIQREISISENSPLLNTYFRRYD
jgi:hypothetical protein